MNIRALDRWHKTRLGYLVFGFVELAVTYVFVSLAIDSGSLWEYILAIVFLFGTVQNLVRALWMHKK